MPPMRRTLASCLLALAVVVACGEEAQDVAETGTTMTTEASSSTSDAAGGTDESTSSTDDDGGGASSSTASTVEDASTSTSTTEPAGSADTPEDAALGLYGAWVAGDESAVPGFAEQAAVDTLFAEDGAGFDAEAEDQGCTADDPAASWSCTWTSGDRTLTMRVEGSDDDGWRVVSATFEPD